ncbi:hypothetical protein GCM10025794_34890 [Massilia kyonggiensis]
MTPLDLAPQLDRGELVALLASLGQEIGDQVSLRTRHRRADGTTYPIKLCFLRIVRDGRSLILAIGDLAAHPLITLRGQFTERLLADMGSGGDDGKAGKTGRTGKAGSADPLRELTLRPAHEVTYMTVSHS